ncbi:MAG TPA: isoprenylcysteine carboxylmethyltransferase family protein [Terriglobia bacterium]
MRKQLIIIRPILATAILAVVLAAAGTIHDPITAVYLAVYGTLRVAMTFSSRKRLDAGERNSSLATVDSGVPLLGSVLFLATVTIAALDSGRLNWSPSMPGAARIIGLAALALAGSLQVWTMAVNPFFSPGLRIRRNHPTVASGPYRFIRHPGYLAMLVATPATAIALGSVVALLPAFGYEFLILRRAMREDELLHEHLRGYAEYAGTVRGRIVPGLW